MPSVTPLRSLASVGIATVTPRANHDRARANHDRARANYDRAGANDRDRASGIDNTPSSSKHVQSANTGKRNCEELGPNKRERAHENLIKSGQPIVKREAVQWVFI